MTKKEEVYISRLANFHLLFSMGHAMWKGHLYCSFLLPQLGDFLLLPMGIRGAHLGQNPLLEPMLSYPEISYTEILKI